MQIAPFHDHHPRESDNQEGGATTFYVGVHYIERATYLNLESTQFQKSEIENRDTRLKESVVTKSIFLASSASEEDVEEQQVVLW